MNFSNPNLSARMAKDEDQVFLLELFHHGLAAELVLFGFHPEQERSFVQMQFRARSMHYLNAFPAADDLILLLNGQDVGRLLLNYADGMITLVDIALLPQCCGQGLGTQILQDLISDAQCDNRAIELYVEQHSRARKLYLSLGFELVQNMTPYDHLIRKAPKKV